MDRTQWVLLANSIGFFILGVVIWVVIRPKLETTGVVETKPNSHSATFYRWIGAPEKQMFFSKRYQKNYVSFVGIMFIIISILMAIAFIVSLFK
jgi:hypothetical protein